MSEKKKYLNNYLFSLMLKEATWLGEQDEIFKSQMRENLCSGMHMVYVDSDDNYRFYYYPSKWVIDLMAESLERTNKSNI